MNCQKFKENRSKTSESQVEIIKSLLYTHQTDSLQTESTQIET